MFFDINNSSYPFKLADVKKLIIKICQSINFYKNSRISIAFVDNRTIKKLNRSYRKKNKQTTILSFAEKDARADFFKKKERVKYLGEIIISYPALAKQAIVKKSTIKKELGILLTHGLLHLAGYDHQSKRQATRMERLENGIIKKIEKNKYAISKFKKSS